MNRIINIKNSERTSTVQHESSARTLGDLLEELDYPLEGKKYIVRETRTTLETFDSELPAEGFTLYVYPAKTKAGAETEELTVDDVMSLSFHALRSECASRGLPANAISKADMQENLIDFITPKTSKSFTEIEETVDIIEECREEINEKLDSIIRTVRSMTSNICAFSQNLLEEIDRDYTQLRDELGL